MYESSNSSAYCPVRLRARKNSPDLKRPNLLNHFYHQGAFDIRRASTPEAGQHLLYLFACSSCELDITVYAG